MEHAENAMPATLNDASLPLVSIGIVTYNQKDFLRECIESALAQDYPHLEIVVADDGSKDGTHEMLRDYQARYPGKFVLRLAERNQGITANSNAAHFACTGKYIAWMGGDDLLLPSKIRRQVEFMEAHPDCTLCYHNLDVFQSDTDQTLFLFNARFHPEGDVRTAIRHGTFNGACSTMVRRDKTPARGFNPAIPMASDWLYWVETLHHGGSVRYLDEVLGRYRRHGGNVTASGQHRLAQTHVDHLSSCQYILALDIDYLDDVMHAYSQKLLALRQHAHFAKFAWYSFVLSPSLKGAVRLLLYYISLGKIRK